VKRFLLISLTVILASVLILSGCPQEEETTPPPTTPPPTTPPTTAPPASFQVSNLTIMPPEAETGEAVDISVTVFNMGGSSGSYSLVLKINDANVEETSVTVAAKGGQRFSFSVTEDEAGSYNVDVNGLTGSFTVVAPPPAGGAYTWEEAKDHIGETATVTGPIIDTLDIGTSVLLGMGVSAYDAATVGIELPKADLDKYPEDLYVGKTIAVTGELYQNPYGGANVLVTDPAQIVEQ
jgi:hypothetical protein